MIIKDEKYEIKVDVARGIVYQTHKEGLFNTEDLQRLDNDYKKKIIPLLRGRKWAKHCDLRNYKLGIVGEDMNEHNTYCIQNGMSDVALIVESAIVKMQMNRAGKHVDFAPTAFTNETEANSWLRERGY